MATLGTLLDWFEDTGVDDSDAGKKKFTRLINMAYSEVYGMKDWSFAKRETALTVTSLSATVPVVLPANFVRHIGTIKDVDDKYFFAYSKDRVNLKHYYNWFFDDPVSDVLGSGMTLAVSANGTSLTSSAEFPATTCVGEFIRIGENQGMYEVATWTSTSAMTITEGFRGEDIQDGDTYFEVRPVGTPQINFCTNERDFKAPGAPVLAYVVAPLPLYNRYDVIYVPGDAGAVFQKAVKKFATSRGWDRLARVAEDDFNTAFETAQRTEPKSDEMIKPPALFKHHSKAARWGM